MSHNPPARRFEIFCDGRLREVAVKTVAAIDNYVTVLANRHPEFRWEARAFERRRTPDRRDSAAAFVRDHRPNGGALIF